PVRPPVLQVTNNMVKELESLGLSCLSNDTGISFHWLFNGQSLHLKPQRMQLFSNDSILSIDPVTLEDSGNYQCKVSNTVSSEESNVIQLSII
ncbi:carcinoembryonic antigen-related cell adhesion molecule 1-like, partial [Sigmodon hispidus]